MNLLKGQICELLKQKDIILAKIACKQTILNVLMLDTLKDLKIGTKVELLFKEHELCFTFAKTILSVENSFLAKIDRIEKGELLYHIFFDFQGDKLSSIITKEKALELEICENQVWLCFVKANDIILRINHA
ncbi:molybdenum-pterin-binding protein [Campylobacter sp. VicNov18]|uniref:TOBE domain-containing protein n=1 Tax=Campylobacter bilis TaxID=2691918 RepID=UPI00130D9A3D|nr:molybdenum-pterin-binding protein [Campylobacter bilis]MPV63255.1 molybdenum-pterin-binding protein [Campylobacter hepaticus]MBM0636754.1 molybdenum-pterin-binding protein [Campylobacter bilis]MCC8277326.1 molybdenum-pterin-binding protein [Campylobacter bilis]MCC8299069.1 molybdenum-pterin-binding protein [Campylobacter bilis]MCC8300235.1 molybdenum-pterin-binding protein [Campylobacter bilis]